MTSFVGVNLGDGGGSTLWGVHFNRITGQWTLLVIPQLYWPSPHAIISIKPNIAKIYLHTFRSAYISDLAMFEIK